MKKPKIQVQSETTVNHFITINGLVYTDSEIAEIIEEMIDALIESTKLLEHLKSVETEAELIHEIEQQISMNKYSALKKAGVEL